MRDPNFSVNDEMASRDEHGSSDREYQREQSTFPVGQPNCVLESLSLLPGAIRKRARKYERPPLQLIALDFPLLRRWPPRLVSIISQASMAASTRSNCPSRTRINGALKVLDYRVCSIIAEGKYLH